MATASEVVERAFGLWNDGAHDAWRELYDPNVVIVPPDDWPEAEVLTDRAAWEDQARRLRESWDSDRLEIDALEEVGDSLLVEFRWVIRGQAGALEFERPFFTLVWVRDGRIVRQAFYATRAAALEALEAGGEDVHRSP